MPQRLDATRRPSTSSLPILLLVLALGVPATAQDAPTDVAVCDDDSRPLAFAWADLDADGVLDLAAGCGPEGVAASAGPGHVDVLLGTGDGGFERHGRIPFDGGVTGVALADVNGDGRADLAANVAGPHERTLVVAPGDGAGGFGEGVRSVTGSTLSGAAIVDVDGDGAADVAMPGENTTWRNRGTEGEVGPFAATRLADFGERRFLHLADVDADGRRDVAHVRADRGRIDLVATAESTPAEVPLGKAVRGVLDVLGGGDLNGDGTPDLVVATLVDPRTREVRLALSGEGNWPLSEPLPSLGHPAGVEVGDVTGDGTLDLVAVPRAEPDRDAYALRVAAGAGEGTFAAALEVPLEGFPYEVRLADVTGDGVLDVLQRDMDAKRIRVLAGPLATE